MYTPPIQKERRNLRNTISRRYPGHDPQYIFTEIKSDKAPVVTFMAIAQFCDEAQVNSDHLHEIFAPYGVTEPYLTFQQFQKFLYDDFPDYNNSTPLGEKLTDRQRFLLLKFAAILRTKLEASLIKKWNVALTRNPPNALNTTLRISALCKLFSEMSLPFTVSEFVDAIFVFYDAKLEDITFYQFAQLFAVFQ